MEPVPSGSVDAVWTSHTLEHLHPYDVPLALAEFCRVLVPGGLAFMCMPDLQRAAEHIAAGQTLEPLYDTLAGPVTALDLIFGHHALTSGNPFNQHRTGFTAQTLSVALLRAGFHRVKVERLSFDLYALGEKPCNR
jgi:ubiquinone/menaquinone biosynthesis C-methylase UbiE